MWARIDWERRRGLGKPAEELGFMGVQNLIPELQRTVGSSGDEFWLTVSREVDCFVVVNDCGICRFWAFVLGGGDLELVMVLICSSLGVGRNWF
jgi:hypothetical protein